MSQQLDNSSDWMPMARNWAAQWHSLAYLNGHSLSFRVTNTDEQTLVFENVDRFGLLFCGSFKFVSSPMFAVQSKKWVYACSL
jgi:hypothetical protein